MEADAGGRAQRASIELLRQHATIGSDIGSIVVAAAAQCAPLDDAAIEYLEGGFPGTFYRRPTVEGDLVATTTGLFYVVPKAGYVWSRAWPLVQVEAGRVPKLAFRRAQLLVTADNEEYVFLVTPRAAIDELVRAAAAGQGGAPLG